MSELINTLLRWGIIASISDREVFVEKVTAVLEQYRADPNQAEKLAQLLTTYLEDVKENMNTKRIIKKFLAEGKVATKDDIKDLQTTLQELIQEFNALNKRSNV